MTDRIPQDVLEKYLWDSAKLLRTNIDAGSYKQYIFPLLFFKRLCDVFDEKKAADEAKYGTDAELYADDYLFKIPLGAHWRDVRDVSEDVGEALVKAFKAIENENPDQLTGIFGDAAWTNKKRLPDRLLKDLMEHFSSQTLSLARCPEDELGKGYEYLIKQFADDSGHTAQEFYTNRTVVALMTEMLRPQPKESIYDPTCGSGGMLISAIKWLKDRGEEYRNVRIYGQEINAITSAIARMNLFLHGIADFHIVNADTLKYPAFVKGGKLQTFDMVLDNPPYSIKQWDRSAFEDDKWGRNFLGTPPQGRADYAFFQHILKSLDPKTGRCAILFPHGVLFRDEERAMRKKLLSLDWIDCVIGLGPNLFFNSAMEACIVICRTNKDASRRGKILFIDAKLEVSRKNTESWLEASHIKRIAAVYHKFADEKDFAVVASNEDVLANNASLAISNYVRSDVGERRTSESFAQALLRWDRSAICSSAATHELIHGTKGHARLAVDSYEEVNPFEGASPVRFGDLVKEVKVNIDREHNPCEYYVAGDHMDSEDLEIHRKGCFATDDVGPAFTRLFKPGQVLYGSRRTYLKKVAVADFEGIVANTTFVLETADQNRFLQELIPFLILSDDFTDYSIKHSKGSTNPYILFSDLAAYTFSLPPLAEQKKLAETLWAMERVKRAYKKLLAETDRMVEARFIEMFGADSCETVKVEALCEFITKGTTPKSSDIHDKPFDGAIPYLKVYNLSSNGCLLFEEKPQYISRVIHDGLLARSKVYPNDVLMNIVGPPLGKFALVTDEFPQWNINQAIAIFRSRGKVLPAFLLSALRTKAVLEPLLNNAAGVRQLNISLEQCRNIEIPLPPLPLQREFAAFVEQAEKAKASLKESLAALTAAQKALMNGAFGEGIAG